MPLLVLDTELNVWHKEGCPGLKVAEKYQKAERRSFAESEIDRMLRDSRCVKCNPALAKPRRSRLSDTNGRPVRTRGRR